MLWCGRQRNFEVLSQDCAGFDLMETPPLFDHRDAELALRVLLLILSVLGLVIALASAIRLFRFFSGV